MADAEIKQLTHQLYSLERPDWLTNAGLDKGIHHDRYALGAILPAGTTMRFRQSHPASDMGVTLHLLNNDSKTESYAKVTTAWSEIVPVVASAPFFTTPYTAKAGERVTVDVEFVGSWKFLPIYKPGVNVGFFFSAWDSYDAEYALFNSTYANILIPAKDKGVLKALNQVSGLQSLTDYYNGVFEYFNYLAGLSFEPAVPTDKNIPNRYFMKADKSGGGAAYYGGGWTAETSDSVASFWLDIKGTNWGSLHEIAHGYEGRFTANSTVNMGEVWNNVLAASYQNKVLGDEVYQKGWLYSGGEERLYAEAMAAFDSENIIAAHHLRLFFYMLMFGRTGEKGIIEFYQRYRRISNRPGFLVENYPAMDLLSRVAIDVSNVDVSAFMSYTKASLSSRQVMENAFSNASPVYPLYLLVPQSDLTQVQRALGLRSPLDLVSCAQLSVTGFVGRVSFNFDGDIYSKIVGKVFLLRDGKGQARVVKVTSPRVTVSDLPVGLYALQLPSVEGGDCQSASYYVAVKKGFADFDCLYVRKYASTLVDQVIYLGGLGGFFCTLTVDVSIGRLLIDVVSESPHSYFPGVVYAAITIKNAQGGVVFSRQMLGDKTTLFHEEISIAQGFTIEVLHKEPSRLKVSNGTASAVIDERAQTNKLRLTERGLVNIDLGTDAGANLRNELEKAAEVFERLPHLVLHDEYPLKEDFKRAIYTFAEPVRSELFERYRALELNGYPIGKLVAGSTLVWFLRGNANRDLGYIRISNSGDWIEFSFSSVEPHEYFSSVYMSVVLRSIDGDVVYSRGFRGDVPAEASSPVRLGFGIGYTLSVVHAEPTRNWILNETDGHAISVGRVQHVTRLTSDHLLLSKHG